MDFEITTNLDTLRNQQITANFEAVDAWLTEELKPYVSMAVTADMIPTAKTYRANLRKVKDRIDAFRKEAKAAALAPYTKFEADCKVLTGKIDEAVDNLDGQVKAFEQAEAEAKIAEIRAEYDASDDDESKIYCPWERVFNPKWANKGYSLDDAKEEVRAALYYTAKDLESIRQMGGDDTAYLIEVYRDAHDLNAVIRKLAELKASREREELRRKVIENEKARKAAETQTAFERDGKEAFTEPPALADGGASKPRINVVDFRVWADDAQLAALKAFLRQNGIKYGRAGDDG